MTSHRHLIRDETWDYFEQVSRKLGYKAKGEKGKEKLLLKLLQFADQKENCSLFRL